MKAVDNELLRFIKAELGIVLKDNDLHKCLFHDLGVAGLDGFQFMDLLFDKFGVDSGNCDYERYFGREMPLNPFLLIFDVIRGIDRRSEVERLEIRHLIKVIELGRWFDPA